jgi:hypothetical protein
MGGMNGAIRGASNHCVGMLILIFRLASDLGEEGEDTCHPTGSCRKGLHRIG